MKPTDEQLMAVAMAPAMTREAAPKGALSPGPWRWGKEALVSPGDYGYVLAIVVSDGDSEAVELELTNPADRAAIALVPELVEALRDAYNDQDRDSHPSCATCGHVEHRATCWIGRARALLARIEGE